MTIMTSMTLAEKKLFFVLYCVFFRTFANKYLTN
jgi:hypothetical protein